MKKKIELYTIGFAQKKAQDFFEILKQNNIKTLIDMYGKAIQISMPIYC